MKKPLLSIFLIIMFASAAQAQYINAVDMKILAKKEDSLKEYVKNVIVDSFTAGRMRSDSQFIKTLVRSLQVKNSFYYPFDSVRGIGNLYAPDSSFRILTWQISFDDYYCRQRGAIQFKTDNGALNLIPLWDASEFTDFPGDSVRTKNNWIGAVYYNMIMTEHKGKKYYTLFGFDANGVRSNKKWIEVLSFDSRNMPVFGGQFFSYQNDSIPRPTQNRFSIEYKKEASALVNYEPELGIILVDHLISETDEPELPWTYIPDGSLEGFKWQNGKWMHIDKVFDQALEDGQAPVPVPLKDNKGNNNDELLKQNSQRNRER